MIFQDSSDEGQALASLWDCAFFETSAALRHFVDDAFHCIIREIRQREFERSNSANCARKDKKKFRSGSADHSGPGCGGTAGKDLGKIFRKIFQ